MHTLKIKRGVINTKSDLTYRLITFAIIAPSFLAFFYGEVFFDLYLKDRLGSWVAWQFVIINSLGLLAMIGGFLFMRGHNNRQVLYFDSVWPFVFWPLYMRAATPLIESNQQIYLTLLYLAGTAIPVAYTLFRIHLENKVLLWVGKYGTGILDKLGKQKTADKLESKIFACSDSKGTTNFQCAMLIVYSAMFAIAFANAAWYLGVAAVSDFAYTDPSLLASTTEYFGFSMWSIADEIDTWLTVVASMILFYSTMTDYKHPDQIGRPVLRAFIPNFYGRGAMKLD